MKDRQKGRDIQPLAKETAMCVRRIPSCGIVFLCLASLCLAEAPTFYVSPHGSDDWSGRLPDPNADNTDGPLATLERARDAIRKLKASGKLPAAGCIVELRSGIYELGQPFELENEDSGTPDARIVYRGCRRETARLIAGKMVDDFQPVNDPAILDLLDPAARGHVLQADLRALGVGDLGSVEGGIEVFFGDKAMTLARWPNEGFVRIVEMVGEPVRRDRHMTHTKGIFVYDGDRPKRWANEKDIWVHGYWFHDWADQRHRVKHIDVDRRIIEVEPPYHGYGYRKGKWYYAFNLLSELDRPGEWYADRETGMLYFWPPGPPAKGKTMVSVLGEVAKLQEVSHVTIQRLTMEAARGTAVTIQGGAQNEVVGCTFRLLGGWAVRVSGGQRHGVVGCDVYETGEGGIALSGGDRKTLAPAGHYAENNHIHHYARVKRVYRPGITLQGVGNRASHNLIHNAPHMGMGFGGNDHLIELNEIHSVCYESNDAGAIYTGRNWTMRGTVIRHNYLHHISGFEDRGCVGVYLDDGFSGTQVFGNVFYKVTRAAMVGGGRDNTIDNNIFVDCRPAIHVDARGVGWANQYIVPGGGWRMQDKLKEVNHDQPPYGTKYPHLAQILEDEPYVPKYTLIARNVIVGESWDGIQKAARPYVTMEQNLIGQDPHFVDDAGGDFQLREDSPAYRLGFERIPTEKIGLYEDPRRASWPVTHTVR